MVDYGDPFWRPPAGPPLAACLFWVVPDVHRGFPSPWRFWLDSGMIGSGWGPRATELELLKRCLFWLDLPSFAVAARVCRAWRHSILHSHEAWLHIYRRAQVELDLPRLRDLPCACDGAGGRHRHARALGCGAFGCGSRAGLALELGGSFHARKALRAILGARARIRASLPGALRERSHAATVASRDARRPAELELERFERSLGAWLPLGVREALKLPLLGARRAPNEAGSGEGGTGAAAGEDPGLAVLHALVTARLGGEWRARLRPLLEWACADELAPSLAPRVGPVRSPQRPVVIGEAWLAAEEVEPRCVQLVLFDGVLFGAQREQPLHSASDSQQLGLRRATSPSRADDHVFCVCHGALVSC